MKRASIFILAVTIASTAGLADELPQCAKPQASASSPDAISVKFSGGLNVGVRVNKGFELTKMKLTSANVYAGGTTIHLDWSRSDRIRDELIWWSLPRAGDIRVPHAVVKGEMLFKPLRDLRGGFQDPHPGISADTPVPVVVVESIKVYLARPGSNMPTGPQHDRKLVEAKASVTEQ